MSLKKLFLLAVVALAGSSIFAFERGDCFVIQEKGEEVTVSGTLSSKDGETLLTDGSKVYEILRGPGMFSYKDGEKVELTGYLYEMKILPTKVKIGGIEVAVGPRRYGRRFSDNRFEKNGKGRKGK